MAETTLTISADQDKKMDAKSANGSTQTCSLSGDKCGCLENKFKDPAWANKPARDFTFAEARDYLVYLHQQGEIKLANTIKFAENQVCCDSKGCSKKAPEIIQPHLWSVFGFGRMAVAPEMNGVKFVNLGMASLTAAINRYNKIPENEKEEQRTRRDSLADEKARKQKEVETNDATIKSNSALARETKDADVKKKAVSDNTALQSSNARLKVEMKALDDQFKKLNDPLTAISRLIRACSTVNIINLESRMVIGLSRLAKKLKAEKSVTHITHLGIGTSAPTHSCSNCHWTGKAADISGFIVTSYGAEGKVTGSFEFDDKITKGYFINVIDAWGKGARDTKKNKEFINAPENKANLVFFSDIYEHFKDNFSIKDDNTPEDNKGSLGKTDGCDINGDSGFVVNPNNDTNHYDHYHVQIGQTEILPKRYGSGIRLCYYLNGGSGPDNQICNCIVTSIQSRIYDFFRKKIAGDLDKLDKKYADKTASVAAKLQEANASLKDAQDKSKTADDALHKAQADLSAANDKLTDATTAKSDADSNLESAKTDGDMQKTATARSAQNSAQTKLGAATSNQKTADAANARADTNQKAAAAKLATATDNQTKAQFDFDSTITAFKSENKDALEKIGMVCSFMDFVLPKASDTHLFNAALMSIEMARGSGTVPQQSGAGSNRIAEIRGQLKKDELTKTKEINDVIEPEMRAVAVATDETTAVDHENTLIKATLSEILDLRSKAYTQIQNELKSLYNSKDPNWVAEFKKQIDGDLFTKVVDGYKSR
jgi:hypothetical protein